MIGIYLGPWLILRPGSNAGGSTVIAAQFVEDGASSTVEVRVTPRVSTNFNSATGETEVRVNG